MNAIISKKRVRAQPTPSPRMNPIRRKERETDYCAQSNKIKANAARIPVSVRDFQRSVGNPMGLTTPAHSLTLSPPFLPLTPGNNAISIQICAMRTHKLIFTLELPALLCSSCKSAPKFFARLIANYYVGVRPAGRANALLWVENLQGLESLKWKQAAPRYGSSIQSHVLDSSVGHSEYFTYSTPLTFLIELLPHNV